MITSILGTILTYISKDNVLMLPQLIYYSSFLNILKYLHNSQNIYSRNAFHIPSYIQISKFLRLRKRREKNLEF